MGTQAGTIEQHCLPPYCLVQLLPGPLDNPGPPAWGSAPYRHLGAPVSVNNQDSPIPPLPGQFDLGSYSIKTFLSDDTGLCQVDKATWDTT